MLFLARRSPARVAALLSTLAQRSPGAAAEAATWHDASARWLAGMVSRFAPYRDVMQPLALAVYELKFGFAMAAAAADADAAEPPSALTAALTALLSFPSAHTAAGTLAHLAGSDAAAAVLTAPVSSHAEQLSLASMMDTECQADAGAQTPSARHTDALRIELLRVALVASGDAASRAGVTTASSWAVLRGLFSRAADLWAAARTVITEAEIESLSEFRSATRNITAAVAEAAAADEEAAYRERFVNASFADLEAPVEDAQRTTAELAVAAAAAAAVAAAKAAAAPSARSQVFGAALLEDLLCVHWAATSTHAQSHGGPSVAHWHEDIGPAAFAPHGTPVWAAALCSTHEHFSVAEVRRCARAAACQSIGTRVLRAAGGARGDVLQDADVAGGTALHVCLEHIRLARGISAGAWHTCVSLAARASVSAARARAL
jgi:hypothetical protein